jgi:hypothetical protein
MRWLSILVLALALVAAGCGGGDDESSASGDTTVEETTTSDTTTTEDDGSGTSGEDFDFADEDCQALLGVGATIAAAFSAAGGDTGDANTEELAELADRVPDEIRADVQTLADAFGEYAAKLQEIGIDAGATPTAEQVQELQAAIASLDQAELTAASERLEAWAQDNCTG